MNVIISIFGYIFDKCYRVYNSYKQHSINELLGGGNRIISAPYIVRGASNIISEEPFSIGPNSTIYTTRAKLIIKNMLSLVLTLPSLLVIITML